IDYYTHERYGIHSMFAGNARTKADQGTYATDLFKREALRFIRNGAANQPWILYLCFNAPHGASSFGVDENNPKSRAGVQAPDEVPARRVSDEFFTTLELMPTLAAAAGTRPPAGVTLDGYDMLPTLAGRAQSPRREMFWEYRGQKAARVGNYKWLESEQGRGLFDLSTDIGEKQDVSIKLPEVTADISRRWTAWRKQMDEAEPR